MTIQQRSQAILILGFLADGPKPLNEVFRNRKGTATSLKSRMSELRSAGLIQDTVALTPEGKAVLEKYEKKCEQRKFCRYNPKK